MKVLVFLEEANRRRRTMLMGQNPMADGETHNSQTFDVKNSCNNNVQIETEATKLYGCNNINIFCNIFKRFF